jgi:hypothetical protein
MPAPHEALASGRRTIAATSLSRTGLTIATTRAPNGCEPMIKTGKQHIE